MFKTRIKLKVCNIYTQVIAMPSFLVLFYYETKPSFLIISVNLQDSNDQITYCPHKIWAMAIYSKTLDFLHVYNPIPADGLPT